MVRMTSPLTLLCLAASIFTVVQCSVPGHGEKIGENEADAIADAILDGLDGPRKGKDVLSILAVPDPENIPQDPTMSQEGATNENEFQVQPRLLGSLASTLLNSLRRISQSIKTSLLSFFRNLRKASKYVLNKVSESTKKVWQKLKDKVQGPLKDRAKKAGKKLVKKVLREVFEEGAEMAIEYVQALVVEYIHEKSQEEWCECPLKEETVRCRCCIQPPGFAKACMVIRARPKLKWFVFSFRYNGTEFMKSKIAEDDRGPCEKGTDDVSRKVCRNLPHYLHFLNMCFLPGDIYETEDGGFVGCFTLTVDSLKLGIEKCVLFTPTEDSSGGETSLFSPEELGLESE